MTLRGEDPSGDSDRANEGDIYTYMSRAFVCGSRPITHNLGFVEQKFINIS